MTIYPNENLHPASSLISCECRDGGFGAMCEYGAPCLRVKTSGKGLDYKFRGEYLILKEDESDLVKLEFGAPFFKRANRTMTASLRPVYYRPAGGGACPPELACTEGNENITAGQIDDTHAVLFHDGTKWVMARITDLTDQLGKTPTMSALTQFFRVHK
jgi:hypothetical protein